MHSADEVEPTHMFTMLQAGSKHHGLNTLVFYHME
jgi:hypothetical protein